MWAKTAMSQVFQDKTGNAYCGAAGPVSKMASQQENAFCFGVQICDYNAA
jgi:hypothetical protein